LQNKHFFFQNKIKTSNKDFAANFVSVYKKSQFFNAILKTVTLNLLKNKLLTVLYFSLIDAV
jgi:hypothetical protein